MHLHVLPRSAERGRIVGRFLPGFLRSCQRCRMIDKS
jgi:hypothetical protein